MKVQRASGAWLLALVITAGCTTDRDAPSFQNPLDPGAGEGLPIPESIVVTVGDNVVELRWSLPTGESADEYAIFRRRVDVAGEEERLLDVVSDTSYVDTGVRNERTYRYHVAAGVDGVFGERSEDVQATPGVFSIVIAGDDDVTSSRSITVSGNAQGATAIQLTEDVNDFSSPWRPLGGTIGWTLSAGDGLKTLYGRFRLSNGSVTQPVFDEIRLDTRALIDLVEFDGDEVRVPGDMIHFRIDAGETNGAARVTVSGVFQNTALFDDGTGGDPVAGDGIYERDLVIPLGASAFEALVTGNFTDEAGNQAEARVASRRLTALPELEPVALTDAVIAHPPDAASVTLRWTRYMESDFSRYRVVRSISSPVGEGDEQINASTSSGTQEFRDDDVVEGLTYYYRVFVEDRQGRQVGSNELSALVPNERPPAAVTIDASPATSRDRVALEWSASTATDFAAYRVYRNESGAVTDLDDLVAEISDVSTSFHDDQGLTENTTYYYRVYTVDAGGLTSRSDEVSATTDNAPPAATFIDTPTQVTSTAATLTWFNIAVHDFDKYELYRDESPTVTRGSTLVVELDDQTFTSHRDQGLEPGTTYYYRVFIVDDGDQPLATGSNTVTVMTTTPRGMQ